MKHWIKLLVTVALAVSIPVQGFAAVMMPACNASDMAAHDSTTMSAASMNMEMGMDMTPTVSIQAKHDCSKPANSSHTSHHSQDQKCHICHLSTFHPHQMQLLVLADNATAAFHDLISKPYHITPPPLFHPPRSLFPEYLVA